MVPPSYPTDLPYGIMFTRDEFKIHMYFVYSILYMHVMYIYSADAAGKQEPTRPRFQLLPCSRKAEREASSVPCATTGSNRCPLAFTKPNPPHHNPQPPL
jgi:hypothetical protein